MTGDAPAPDTFWQRVVREVADDLASDALDRDRAGKPPYDEVARLREAGLPAVLTPPGPDGRGTAWPWACAAVRRTAAADGSVGELLGRHAALSWSARFFAAPERAAVLERTAADAGWLWGGDTGAYGAGGGHLAAAEPLFLTPVADGFLLGGSREFATAVGLADRLALDAVRTDTGDALVVVVDPAHPAVAGDPTPGRFGQRLAGAGTVHFDDVPIAPDQVLGAAAQDEHATVPFATLAPLALRLMLANVALGVAEGALAEAGDAGRAGGFGPGPYGAADPAGWRPPGADIDADALLAYGELALAVHTAAAVVTGANDAMDDSLGAGRELTADQRAETAVAVASAETVATRTALLVGERVLGLADSEGLDRFWRNARVLVGRGLPAVALRSIGDHFLHTAHRASPQWM